MPTLDEIRHDGLEALRARLGITGTIRFLQMFSNGKGDYTKLRRVWVDRTSMDDLMASIKKNRKQKQRAKKS